MIRRLLRSAGRRAHALFTSLDEQVYWEDRARKLGSRAVVDRRYGDDELPRVTQRQMDLLFPPLRERLSDRDRVVLDFGCGPGRFTRALADLVDGRAIGVDPVQALLDLAPVADNVEYRRMESGTLPVISGSVDVVWVCLVLGGILRVRDLRKAAREIDRVLRPGGLLFLVENTTPAPSAPHWRFRPPESYLRLFRGIDLHHVLDYEDFGETISAMVGRKSN